MLPFAQRFSNVQHHNFLNITEYWNIIQYRNFINFAEKFNKVQYQTFIFFEEYFNNVNIHSETVASLDIFILILKIVL